MSQIDFSQVITAEAQIAARLDLARTAALARLTEMIDAETLALTGAVPLVEQLAWAGKEAAARAVLAGTASGEQHGDLAAEALLAGEPVYDLAQKIIARADLFRAGVARLSGLRRQAAAAIALCRSPEDVAIAVADLSERLGAA